MKTIYTVGHSAHEMEALTALLLGHGIQVVVDTRSSPYSRFAPQFDRTALQKELASAGLRYLFLGAEVGGRPANPSYYDSRGRVLYGKLTSDSAFLSGIERLERGMAEYRVALLCGEEDPAHCHRRLLIGRVLIERGHQVLHIRGDGRLESEAEVAACSNKPLAAKQPALFADLEEDQWRSTASVSPRKAQASSSVR